MEVRVSVATLVVDRDELVIVNKSQGINRCIIAFMDQGQDVVGKREQLPHGPNAFGLRLRPLLVQILRASTT
jgi:hypothetical protein